MKATEKKTWTKSEYKQKEEKFYSQREKAENVVGTQSKLILSSRTASQKREGQIQNKKTKSKDSECRNKIS